MLTLNDTLTSSSPSGYYCCHQHLLIFIILLSLNTMGLCPRMLLSPNLASSCSHNVNTHHSSAPKATDNTKQVFRVAVRGETSHDVLMQ